MSFNKAQSNSEPSTRIIVLGKDGAVKLSEEGLRKWFQSKSSGGVSGWKQAGGAYDGKPCARQDGQKSTPKCVSSDKYSSMSKKERSSAHSRKNSADPNQPEKSGAAKPTYVSTDKPKKVKESYIDERSLSKSEKKEKERLVKGMKKSYKDFKARYGKDAESVMYATATSNAKDETVDEGLAQARANVGAKKCWPGMKAKGTKTKNGKEVPNCVKEEEELVNEKAGEKDACYKKVKASAKVWPSAYASGRLVQCRKKGAGNYGKSTKKESYLLQPFSSFLDEQKKNCGCGKDPCEKYGKKRKVEESAAWTKKSGKNSEGGLNEKGRKSYEAENPGSDLKAPSKKAGNPRRASFCARMKGMKKKLTSAKTSRDPDSRINKSLRKWNC